MNEDQRRAVFQRCFVSDAGRMVLEELSSFAHADEAEFCLDPRKDAYMQGRRSVILEIRKWIKEKKDNE